jgi:hypothetical protein
MTRIVRSGTTIERPPVPVSAVIHEPKQQSVAARARWAMREANELEWRAWLRSSPLQEALDFLAELRKTVELASRELNQRVNDEAMRVMCTTCGGPPKKNGLWVMQGATRDPETGLDIPYQFCDVYCVRERNKKRLLPKRNGVVEDKSADVSELGDIR